MAIASFVAVGLTWLRSPIGVLSDGELILFFWAVNFGVGAAVVAVSAMRILQRLDMRLTPPRDPYPFRPEIGGKPYPFRPEIGPLPRPYTTDEAGRPVPLP